MNKIKKIKNYIQNIWLHIIYNILEFKKNYSNDRLVLNNILNLDFIKENKKILSVGVAHYTYSWPRKFQNFDKFDTIDIDVTKRIFGFSSSHHRVEDFFNKDKYEKYDLLILFGIADYCGLERYQFKEKINTILNEITPKYIIINFNQNDEIINEIDKYGILNKYISNSTIYILKRIQ